MKNLILFIVFMTTLAVYENTAFAQNISKAEKKALQKELKEMSKNPIKYKQFKEGIQEKKDAVTKLDGQIEDLNESINNTQQQARRKTNGSRNWVMK